MDAGRIETLVWHTPWNPFCLLISPFVYPLALLLAVDVYRRQRVAGSFDPIAEQTNKKRLAWGCLSLQGIRRYSFYLSALNSTQAHNQRLHSSAAHPFHTYV